MAKVLSYVESKGGNFFKAPVGSHPAIIVWIAELWTAMSNYGKDDREQDLIRVLFEIEASVNTARDWQEDKFEDKIFTAEQDYNCIVTNKSKLWKMIAWVFGQQASEIKWFSLDKLLWKKCVINVIHSDWWFASVDSVSMESKKMNYHEQVKESFYFGLNEKEFSEELFDSFAPFVRARIEKSDEFKKLMWIETLDEQEETLQKEVVTSKDAEAVFEEELMTEEPKSVTEARAKAKAPANDDFFGEE